MNILSQSLIIITVFLIIKITFSPFPETIYNIILSYLLISIFSFYAILKFGNRLTTNLKKITNKKFVSDNQKLELIISSIYSINDSRLLVYTLKDLYLRFLKLPNPHLYLSENGQIFKAYNLSSKVDLPMAEITIEKDLLTAFLKYSQSGVELTELQKEYNKMPAEHIKVMIKFLKSHNYNYLFIGRIKNLVLGLFGINSGHKKINKDEQETIRLLMNYTVNNFNILISIENTAKTEINQETAVTKRLKTEEKNKIIAQSLIELQETQQQLLNIKKAAAKGKMIQEVGRDFFLPLEEIQAMISSLSNPLADADAILKELTSLKEDEVDSLIKNQTELKENIKEINYCIDLIKNSVQQIAIKGESND